MKHPTRQEEYQELLVAVIAIAAKERGRGDPGIAKAFVERWIGMATEEYAKELLARRNDPTLERMEPCGHC